MTPVLGVLKANLFVRLLHSKDATSAELVYALPVRARSVFRFFARFSCRFILHFHVSLVVDCLSGWSRCLEICVAQALFANIFPQMVTAIV